MSWLNNYIIFKNPKNSIKIPIDLINENTQLSIMLKLSEESEFITLIDNWQVQFE